MPWIGGKQSIAKLILDRFPPEYRRMRYVELFGGGASLLLNKERSAMEVLNDYDGNLINLYRCVRERPDDMVNRLTFVLNSRADFKEAAGRIKEGHDTDRLQWAADFYQVIRQSYGGKGDSFGANPRGLWSAFPIIYQVCARLQGVVIENEDFQKVFLRYDSENTFSYLDPPYYFTEDYYRGGFEREDHKRMADMIFGAAGKWLVSYNDCPEVRKLYHRPGVYLEAFRRTSNLAQRYESGAEYGELLLSNYDTKLSRPEQLTLGEF